MDLDEAQIKFEMAVQALTERPPARERLLDTIFVLGFVLVAITAVMRVDMRVVIQKGFSGIGIQPLPYLAAGAWNVLLYFVLGLALMSQSQFARLNARWRFQKIEVSSKLAGR